MIHFSMKSWFARAALACLTLSCGLAHAAGCTIPDAATKVADYQVAIARLKQPSCLGDPKADSADIVTRFESFTNQPILLDESERLVATVEALASLAESRATEATPMPGEWKAVLKELRSVRAQLLTLKQSQTKAQWLSIASEALQPKWKNLAPPAGTINVGGENVSFLRDINCANGEACPDFQSQLDLIRVANLMSRLAGYAQGPSLADHYEDSQIALAQWETYRTTALHQYIWEVWFNGRIMETKSCPKDPGSGMSLGFCRVPNEQWILLHPEAAMRFSNAANSSSELKAALVVELLGYHHWRWQEANGKQTAEMEGRRGISLAATYTDTSKEKRWAFGPMFHLGDYAFALTKAGGGGRWSLVINLPLADKYFGRKQAYVDQLRKVQTSDLAELIRGAAK